MSLPQLDADSHGDVEDTASSLPGPSSLETLDTIIVRTPTTSFPQFIKLPAELQDKIFREALLQPAIIYFNLTPANFSQRTTIYHDSSCHSTFHQWKKVASASRDAAHAVNLLVTQSKTKHYLDARRKRPFNKVDDLVVFKFTPSPWVTHGWTVAVTARSPSQVYEWNFKSLRRVGLKYNTFSFHCPDGGHAPGSNPQGWLQYPLEGPGAEEGEADTCVVQCRDAFIRFPQWFRDADVIYIMVQIPSTWLCRTILPEARALDLTPSQLAASILRNLPKSKSLVFSISIFVR